MNACTSRNCARVLFIAAGCIAALAVLLCVVGRRSAPLLLGDSGDMETAAALFFDHLCAGEYEEAAACCRGTLSLRELPEDERAARVYTRVRESWQWAPDTAFQREGIHAQGRVSFTYLDAAALTAGLREDVNALLRRYVDEAVYSSDIYEAEQRYREEVVLRAWDEALEARLSSAERYLTTIELPVELTYEERTWRIELTEELLRALSGGV